MTRRPKPPKATVQTYEVPEGADTLPNVVLLG